jgi:excisionase family DNA binding protein
MKLIPGQGREMAELPPDEDLWDVKRAAQFLGLSPDGVYRAAERGDIPSIRVLNRRRFIPANLKAWAHSQSQGERR